MDGHHEVEAQQRAGRDRVRAIAFNLSDDEALDLAGTGIGQMQKISLFKIASPTLTVFETASRQAPKATCATVA